MCLCGGARRVVDRKLEDTSEITRHTALSRTATSSSATLTLGSG